MKYLKYIVLGLIVAFATTGATAQVVKKSGDDRRDKKDEGGVHITGRQQAFYEQREPTTRLVPTSISTAARCLPTSIK